MTLAAERPVQSLTLHYDPLSYAAYDHPYEVYRLLRDQAPVYYNARRDLYVVSRYADVRACLKRTTSRWLTRWAMTWTAPTTPTGWAT
jgi:cytochrome P450